MRADLTSVSDPQRLILRGVFPPMSSSLSNEIDRSIGKSLKQRRLLCGLTHAKLAARVDLCDVDVARYERGLSRFSPEMLLTISRALDMPLDQIVAAI